MVRWGSGLPAGQDLLEPVLAVHEAGDDIGDHIVAGGVDHSGRGVHQVADGDGDGVGDGHLIGEEHGAHDELADVAAAGHAGHAHGGQNGHHDHQGHVADAVEGLAEHAEQEHDLQNA